MYGARRYILSTLFGGRTSPNRRTSAQDGEWQMTPDWVGVDGGYSTSGRLMSLPHGTFTSM